MPPLVLLELVVPILITRAHRRDHRGKEEDGGYDGCAYYACLEEVMDVIPAETGHLVLRSIWRQ